MRKWSLFCSLKPKAWILFKTIELLILYSDVLTVLKYPDDVWVILISKEKLGWPTPAQAGLLDGDVTVSFLTDKPSLGYKYHPCVFVQRVFLRSWWHRGKNPNYVGKKNCSRYWFPCTAIRFKEISPVSGRPEHSPGVEAWNLDNTDCTTRGPWAQLLKVQFGAKGSFSLCRDPETFASGLIAWRGITRLSMEHPIFGYFYGRTRTPSSLWDRKKGNVKWHLSSSVK